MTTDEEGELAALRARVADQRVQLRLLQAASTEDARAASARECRAYRKALSLLAFAASNGELTADGVHAIARAALDLRRLNRNSRTGLTQRTRDQIRMLWDAEEEQRRRRAFAAFERGRSLTAALDAYGQKEA